MFCMQFTNMLTNTHCNIHTHLFPSKHVLSFLPFQYFPFSQELQVILQLRFSKSDNLEYETKTILTSNILRILPILYSVNLTSQTISCHLNPLWYCEHADYIRVYLQVLLPLDSLFLPLFADNASA